MKALKLKIFKRLIATWMIVVMAPANAAFMTTSSGGVLTGITGFEFDGMIYDISFSKSIFYDDLPSINAIKFDPVTGLSFITELHDALEMYHVNLSFTPAGTDERNYTWAMLPSTLDGRYEHHLQHWGNDASPGNAYGQGTTNAPWDWNIVDPGDPRYTGIIVTAVPIPAAIYLMGAGVIGFFAAQHRKKQKV